MKVKDEVIEFIESYGWKLNEKDSDEDFQMYIKDENISIDISSTEIVLVGDEGDFLHIPLHHLAKYTLFGYLSWYKHINSEMSR